MDNRKWRLLVGAIMFLAMVAGSNLCLAETEAAVTVVSQKAVAENKPSPFFNEVGVIVTFSPKYLSQGTWHPPDSVTNSCEIGIAGHFGTDMGKHFVELSGPGRFTFYFEPIYQQVVAQNAYELGLGVGLEYAYPIFKNTDIFVSCSTGPHYYSILQDQLGWGWHIQTFLGGGFYYHLDNSSAINAGVRLKHTSNARTAYPMVDVNDLVYTLGFSEFIW